jgi:phage tail tape-measure protein
MNGKQKAAMIGQALVSVAGVAVGAAVGASNANIGFTGGAMIGGQLFAPLGNLIGSFAPNAQVSTSDSSSTTTTTENKSVTDMLSLIDESLKRTNEFDSYGMWNVAGYFISDDIVRKLNKYKILQ